MRAGGFNELIAWIGPDAPDRIIYEPTGAYHRRFEHALSLAGLVLVKVNPRQARRFAQALGKLAKTDRADAAMLARLGQTLQPPPRPMNSEIINKLKALNLARQALIKDRTAAKNRQKLLDHPLLKRQSHARLQQIQAQMTELEVEIQALIQTDPNLTQRLEILISIPGLARQTASALLIGMPELGNLDAKQAASLAGLAPMTRQSGQWRGKAHIQGGRAEVRQALYMPALVAARFNPDLKAKYQQLIQAGKPPKVAVTVIMRKLIALANALLNQRRAWEPKPA
jgi:transposase